MLRVTVGLRDAKILATARYANMGQVKLLRTEIVMRPTAAGGRRRPAVLRGAYRPHLRVDDRPPLGVQISSDLADEAVPGQTAIVGLLRLYEIDYSSRQVGTRFAILEEAREVGVVVV